MLLEKHRRLADRIVSVSALDGKAIVPLPGTPLAQLMEVTYQEGFGDVSSNRDFAGVVAHDAIMSALVKTGADTIKTSIRRAREVVKPIVNEITETIGDKIDTMVANKLSHKITIESYPLIYNVPALGEITTRFQSETDINTKIPAAAVPDLSLEQIIGVMKTNISSINEGLDKINENNPGIYSEVFGALFEQDRGHRWITDDAAVIVAFFMCRGMLDQWADLDLRSDGLKLHLTTLSAFFGRKINRTLNKREGDNRRGLIIKRVVGKEIIVSADTYIDWLDKGGRPEVVLGSVMGGLGAISVKGFEIHMDAALRVYEQKAATNDALVSSTKRSTTRDLVRSEIAKIINTDDMFVDVRPQLHERLDTVINEVSLRNDGTYAYVLAVVCRTLFKDTDALKVLNGIDEVMADQPKLTARDAATIVYHELVVGWITSQYKVVKEL